MTLVEFLHARIADDERTVAWLTRGIAADDPDAGREYERSAADIEWIDTATEQSFGSRWWRLAVTSERLLAECDAKRRIIDSYEDHVETYLNDPTQFGEGARFGMMTAIGWLALAYSGHPDFDESWRP